MSSKSRCDDVDAPLLRALATIASMRPPPASNCSRPASSGNQAPSHCGGSRPPTSPLSTSSTSSSSSSMSPVAEKGGCGESLSSSAIASLSLRGDDAYTVPDPARPPGKQYHHHHRLSQEACHHRQQQQQEGHHHHHQQQQPAVPRLFLSGPPSSSATLLDRINELQCSVLAGMKMRGEIDWYKTAFISRTVDCVFGTCGLYSSRPLLFKQLASAVFEEENKHKLPWLLPSSAASSEAGGAESRGGPRVKRTRLPEDPLKTTTTLSWVKELLDIPGAASVVCCLRRPSATLSEEVVQCNELMRERLMSETEIMEWARQLQTVLPMALYRVMDGPATCREFFPLMCSSFALGDKGVQAKCIVTVVDRRGRSIRCHALVRYHWDIEYQVCLGIGFFPTSTPTTATTTATPPTPTAARPARQPPTTTEQELEPPRMSSSPVSGITASSYDSRYGCRRRRLKSEHRHHRQDSQQQPLHCPATAVPARPTTTHPTRVVTADEVHDNPSPPGEMFIQHHHQHGMYSSTPPPAQQQGALSTAPPTSPVEGTGRCLLGWLKAGACVGSSG